MASGSTAASKAAKEMRRRAAFKAAQEIAAQSRVDLFIALFWCEGGEWITQACGNGWQSPELVAWEAIRFRRDIANSELIGGGYRLFVVAPEGEKARIRTAFLQEMKEE